MSALSNLMALIGVLHETDMMVMVAIKLEGKQWKAMVFDPSAPNMPLFDPIEGNHQLVARGATVNEALLNLDALCRYHEEVAA